MLCGPKQSLKISSQELMNVSDIVFGFFTTKAWLFHLKAVLVFFRFNWIVFCVFVAEVYEACVASRYILMLLIAAFYAMAFWTTERKCMSCSFINNLQRYSCFLRLVLRLNLLITFIYFFCVQLCLFLEDYFLTSTMSAILKAVLNDRLTQENLKPWWESLFSFITIVMVVIALTVQLFWETGSFSCVPFNQTHLTHSVTTKHSLWGVLALQEQSFYNF